MGTSALSCLRKRKTAHEKTMEWCVSLGGLLMQGKTLSICLGGAPIAQFETYNRRSKEKEVHTLRVMTLADFV